MNVARLSANSVAAVNAAAIVLGLFAPCTVNADDPIALPKCSMVLSVEVTPDVPNPGNGAFISSLLGNHTEYQLFLLRVVDDTHVNLQRQGSGGAERCPAVVDSMSGDGRVASIQAN